MPRFLAALARTALPIVALISSLSPALAEDYPPSPQPKPAIVVERVVEVEPAPAPAAPLPSAAPSASEDTAAGVYRLIWLLAAIGLGVIGLLAWQVLTQRDAARRRTRAYISVRPGAAPQLDTDWTDATVIVKNSGTTPAFALDHATTLMMLDFPEAPLEEVMGAADKMFGKKSIVLAPGEEITVPLRTVLTEDEKRETEDGTHKRLCALGEIRYLDAFKARRRTRFCFVFGGPSIIASGAMQLADRGNEAD
ncbi:MAG: hypothetical protein GC190_08060 [Alphaproteobacteria bacterium]|nr:hypothetical protein [Alphaproteobacteria bacterium]